MLIALDIDEAIALSPDDTGTLRDAMGCVFDELKASFIDLVNGEDGRATWIYRVLPPYAYSYLDRGLCEQLMITLATLAYKTFGPRPTSLVCIGEILLLKWSIDMMEGLAELEEEPFDAKRWENFLYRVADPLDIWLMYDPRYDGMDHLYPQELSVDTWFTTFSHVIDDVSNPLIRPAEVVGRYTRREGVPDVS